MNCRPKSKAEKNYTRRLMQAMVAYMLLVMLTTWLVRHGHVHGSALYVWSIIPCIPVLRLIHVLALYLQEETDEFQRLLVVRSILWGSAAMLAASAFSDFLRSFANIAAFPPFTMFTLFWCVFGVAQGIQSRMNRAGVDEE